MKNRNLDRLWADLDRKNFAVQILDLDSEKPAHGTPEQVNTRIQTLRDEITAIEARIAFLGDSD